VASYVVAWRRGPLDGAGRGDDRADIVLPVRHLRGLAAAPEVLYPGQAGAGVRWEADAGTLAVALPRAPSACLIRLRAS
jgi:hypothetical protein